MAQRVQIILEDDLDGSSADETVRFGLDGVDYEIDLSADNAEQLRDGLAQWVGHARKVSRGRGAGASRKSSSGGSPTEIREWAKANGLEVNARGRVPSHIKEAYEAAQRWLVEIDLGELYAGPWQDFVAHRDRLAAAARAAGDRPGAQALKALKKPTRGAWLVNLLARHEADQLTEVLELGESLARAHRDADPDELRRLSALRGAVVNSLTARATALGAERGYAAADSVRQEVAETIQAAMADATLADRVLAGTMTATVRAAGFGPADLFAAAPPMTNVIQLRPVQASTALQEPPGPDPGEVRRLSRDLGRAEARWEEAQERLAREETAAAEAAAAVQTQEAQLADITQHVSSLRAELAAAEQEGRAVEARRDALGATASERRASADRAAEETSKLKDVIDRLHQELTELGIEL